MISKQQRQPKLKINLKPNLLLGILLLTLALPLPFATKSIASQQTAAYQQRIFEAALYFTLYFEGGFSNHPADKGGRTYRGILQTEYDAYRYSRGLPPLDVTRMSEAELLEIYQSYWKGSHAASMHPALAIVMFDTAVNFGISNSVTFLQQALGLPQSGVFDDRTVKALAAANNKNTAFQLINERIIYRYKRVQEDPTQMAFFRGWLSRDYSLWGYVEKIKN
ncbi:MAG TPA: glycosyl hydrolase 108 family protein [Kamptonema sp.]|nr:glycosyl hydrolase 108 family protein [Kamptonema sp.]